MHPRSRPAACSRRSASTDPMRPLVRIDRMRWLLCLALVACSSSSAPAPSICVPITPFKDSPPQTIPIVDSHVHLAFYPVADQLAKHGVLAAVDLASPESALGTK